MQQYTVLNTETEPSKGSSLDKSQNGFRSLEADPELELQSLGRETVSGTVVLHDDESQPINPSGAVANDVLDPSALHEKLLIENQEISVWAELFRFAKLSAPSTIVMLLTYLQWASTLSVAAQVLGTEEMSGISLASLTANLTTLTIIYGLLTAVDTLAPQSFGAGNLAEVGILVQRGLIAVFATLSVTIIIWFNAENILLALGQPPNESRFASVFLQYNFASVPALALWESSRRFMWSQDVTQWPFVIIALLALCLHLLELKVLLPILGFIGAPISHIITSWFMVFAVALWIRIMRPHNPETWVVNCAVVMNKEAMITFLKLAIPGVLSMSEWVFFEFFIFLSGTLGPKELAANSVAYTLIPMSFTIPSGLAIATTARVGTLLAQGHVQRAKRLTRAVCVVTLALAATVSASIFLAREHILRAFSSDNEVQELSRKVWPFLSLFLFLDAMFGVQAGLLRALGLQLIYACIVLVCLFLIGLPTISAFAYDWGLNLGLLGMWYAMPGAYFLLNICLFIAHATRNWTKYSEEIVLREKALRQAREELLQREPLRELGDPV